MSYLPIRVHKKKGLIEKVFRRLARPFRILFLKQSLYQKLLIRIKPINTPGKILWVNPHTITEAVLNYENEDPMSTIGITKGGGWDKERYAFQAFPIFKALKEHFQNGKPFNETSFYNSQISTREMFERIGGSRKWEFMTAYEYANRTKEIDALFENIKIHGYKTQQSIEGELNDEIKVKIDRNGEILFSDGIHRLSIAKILNLEKVPVIVTVRHEDWVAFKMKLLNYAKRQQIGTTYQGKLYHKLHHPDLQDIPFAHDNEDRFQAIHNNMLSKYCTVLDIGANFGYFCHALEELGYECVASEIDPELIYFLNKMKIAEDRSFKILEGDILDLFSNPQEFGIVLALNIFHHFLRTEETYRKFLSLLRNLKIAEMFFEPHNPLEKPFKDFYLNATNEDFIRLVLENTGLNRYKKILDCEGGRVLFHLWKQ